VRGAFCERDGWRISFTARRAAHPRGQVCRRALPASVYRDQEQLAALRREVRGLALLLLGPDARRGSRF
jgi:hypothetical protein